MTAISKDEYLLEALKTLADANRLRIVRLLKNQEQTVSALATLVDLTEPTVSHHLARLRNAGLVTLRMAGNQHFYRLNENGLATVKRLVATLEDLPEQTVRGVPSEQTWIAELGWSAEDQEVLRALIVDGCLSQLPSKRKKLLVVLRWLAMKFEPNVYYTENQVNAVLKAAYERDYVSLRRDLVDLGYLRRERGGGRYWLSPAEEEVAPLE